jgi:membrane-associated phospholipid phosphatase
MTSSARRLLASATIATLISFAFDRWAYDHLMFAAVYETDWGRFLRVMGFWPMWAVAALALWLHERGTVDSAKRRALLLAGSPALAAIVGEVLKLLLRRERPAVHAGAYAFRAFTDRPFSTAGIGSPSSHAAVAFGAAAMLALLFPRARWVWYALAAGCGLTRVLARAHFLSDVAVAALVGVVTAAWLWKRYRRK